LRVVNPSNGQIPEESHEDNDEAEDNDNLNDEDSSKARQLDFPDFSNQKS